METGKGEYGRVPGSCTVARDPGIPAVKLFVDGKVAAEFTGALGEPAVRSWLDQHLPSPSRAALEEAVQLLHAGRFSDSASILSASLLDDPDNPELRVRLAQALVWSDPGRATHLLERVEIDADLAALAEAVKQVAYYTERDPDGLPDGEGQAYFAAALVMLKGQDFDAALPQLILALQNDRYYLDDAARKLGVALFALLGPDHPATQQHRRTFDMWLY